MTLVKRLSLRRMLGFFMAIAAFLTAFLAAYNEVEFHKDFYQQQVNYTVKMLSDACRQAEQQLSNITEILHQLALKGSISKFCKMSAWERNKVYEYIQILIDSYTETNQCVAAVALALAEMAE